MSNFYSKLVQNTYTTEDRDSLVLDLDLAARNIVGRSNAASFFKKNLRQKTLAAVAPFLLETSLSSHKKVAEELTAAKKRISEMDAVVVTLAFDPTVGFIEKLALWFRENISKEIVLDIRIDSSIVGGVLVDYEGRYLDLSLASKLFKYFQKINL